MTSQNFTLNLTLSQIGKLCPQLEQFIERQFVSSYEEFVTVLYKDIDFAVSMMQENPELRQNDGEDRLTIDIKNILVSFGYNATHDEKHIGHTDLLVRKPPFVWIGESKIHSSYEYLWQGFLQLTTRYSVATDEQKEGGVIIYIFNKNAQNVMSSWQEHLTNQLLPDFHAEKCKNRELAFFSQHTHDKSGLPFKVRHMPVLLYFNPEDRSGRTRKP